MPSFRSHRSARSARQAALTLERLEARDVLTFLSAGAFATGGLNPQFAAFGDFNGDFRPDVAVANFDSGNVGVLLGSGGGTFQSATTFSTGGTNPYAVAIADFNGDSKLDLIVSNNGSSSVSLLVGNGDGTFQAAQVLPLATTLVSNPEGIAAGDLNHDGHADFVAVSNGAGSGNTISVVLGNGNGTFQTAQVYSVGTGPVGVALADLNHDGFLDIAVTNFADNNVSVLINQQNGTFASAQDYAVGTHPVGIAAAKTSSGLVSLGVANSSDNSLSVLVANGDGTLQPQVVLAAGQKPQGVAAGDFNRDGNADLAAVANGDNAVGVFLSQGDGSFQPRQSTTTGLSPVGVFAGDLNGDGFDDVAVVNNGDKTVSALINLNVDLRSPSLDAAGPTPAGVAVGDFNGDALPDVVVANTSAAEVTVLLGNRHGTFPSANSYAVGLQPTGVTVADFNGDGVFDIATADKGTGSVSVLLGKGDGTFLPAVDSAANSLPVALAAANLNGDGFEDLAVASADGTVAILLNNGNGTFHVFETFSTGLNPSAVATADLNSDSRPDIVVANAGSGNVGSSVSVLLQNSDGTFATPVAYLADKGPSSLALARFAPAGPVDIAVANAGSDDVSLLQGKGDGTFFAPVQYAAGSQPKGLVAADFNRDGLLDLAIADAGDDAVSVLRGNGDHTFGDAVSYGAGPDSAPQALAEGFFNGGPSVVTADVGGTISVLLSARPALTVTGAGPGGGPHIRVLNSLSGDPVREFMAYDPHFAGGVRVAMGDVDGDGDQDIITAPGASGGPHIKVFDGSTAAVIWQFMAYDPAFTGGVYVAVGDVNHDGFADIITGADEGGGPHVEAFSGKDHSRIYSFYAYNPAFLGGVRVAAADVNGDGFADIVTGAGPGGGPHVEVWSGKDRSLLQSYYAYDKNYSGGVFIAAGDVNGDGHADIITGNDVGTSAGANLRVFSGIVGHALLENFFAFPTSFQGGVHVGVTADLNDDGQLDVLAGAGVGGGPHVLTLDGSTYRVLDSYFAYDAAFPGGVFVGGGA